MKSILFFLALGMMSCTSVPSQSPPKIFELPKAESLIESDLQPVRSAIGDKSLVMLGESMHMTSEFSKARGVLIQNLHNSADFNGLFFEGSPVEFWIAEDEFLFSNKDQQAVTNFQKTALFGLWQTNEIRSVLSHVLSTQKLTSSQSMYISSYDVQIGQGRRFSQGKVKVFESLIDRLKKWGANPNKKDQQEILKLENLVSCKRKKFPASDLDYNSALNSIKILKLQIDKAISKRRNALKVHSEALRFIPESLTFSLSFCREANLGARNYTETRDDWAAKQFQIYLLKLKGKNIIWGHSGHLRQMSNREGRMSFGAYMRKILPNNIFSIHFTAKSGTAISFMDEKGNETDLTEKSLLPLENVSLENKLSKLSSKDLFYPVSSENNFFEITESTRSEPESAARIEPYKAFDGYYLIQEVHPPQLQL